MFDSYLDLPDQVRKASNALLQARLSDALDLEVQLKQAHWNVRGGSFFQLHELFDKIYVEVGEEIDALAERITALGGVADGRVQTTARSSSLAEYPLDASDGESHLRATAAALGRFAHAARTSIEAAAGAGDAGTADLFTEISRATDKQLWLVVAHLA
jgi:starvation-inducible DNA-binding protein